MFLLSSGLSASPLSLPAQADWMWLQRAKLLQQSSTPLVLRFHLRETGLNGRLLTLCEDKSFNFVSEEIKIRKKVKQKEELE